MPSAPFVSVITPARNAAEFLEETIRSVLAQDYPHLEYLVMDGGSTDGTLEILERYRGRLQFVSAADGGAADAINRGFRKARGEILAWLGADDLYLPGAIAAAVAALTEDPAAAAVYGEGEWIDETGRSLGRYPTVAPFDADMFRRECSICQPACFLRREAVEAVGGLDDSLQSAFDYDLWIRLSRRYPFRAIPQLLAQSRMHSRNKSLGQKRRMFEECIALLGRHYGYVPLSWVYSYASFLKYGGDQFFTPMRPSPAVYLRSLEMGSRYNARHLARYWKEWLAGGWGKAVAERERAPDSDSRDGLEKERRPEGAEAGRGDAAAGQGGSGRRLKRIAVDLTPLLEGGGNGGAKPLAIELVRRLAAAAPGCEFVLLTAEKSHQELALLDAPNVRRFCVVQPPPARPFSRVRSAIRAALPERMVRRLGAWYAGRTAAPPSTPLLRQMGADLLFCPFTGALFYDPAVPLVSLVHDLQYLYYPEFFEPEDRQERDRHFRQVCRVASRLICVSNFTRAGVLEHSVLPRERVVTIPSAPQKRLEQHAGRARESSGGRYLLYPANFWRHKNHELLLIAFGMYRAAHPESGLKLVLTGAPSARRDELMEATRRMGLAAWVTFPGYLPEEDFAALLAESAAMIFPSLFEGFGMPVLEAMAAGVPVLCGDGTSLPEVAGGNGQTAALLFDARRPATIVAAIERLESDAALRAELVARGRRRAAEFLPPEQMAARYWAVFEEALGHPAESPSAVYGVFPDGWTGPRITVVFGRASAPRRLSLTLRAPEGLPSAEIAIRVEAPGKEAETWRIARGRRQTIALDLPEQAGRVELLCSPAFRPGGGDPRQLGCLLESAAIAAPQGPPRQLPREAHAA